MSPPRPVTAATPAGAAGLTALRREPGRALLGMDFDGTLAPIVPDPAAARADPAVAGVLRRLTGCMGRLAVVTGRPAAVAVELGGLADVAGLVVLGHYGRERWQAGTLTAPPPDAGVDAVRHALPALLADHAADPGITVEDKGSAIAVHTRRAAAPQLEFDRLHAPLAQLARTHGLTLEPGRFVLELRPAGMDKGAALRELVAESSPSCVVFVGDDLGDLAAFDAVDALRADGLAGLLVCSGSDEVAELARRADLVVDGPAGVVALLGRLADELAEPTS